MNPAVLIAKKRDGRELSRDEIVHLVHGFTRGTIPEYQMAAFAMAVYLRGMTTDETAALTDAMLQSGVWLVWPTRNKPVVDKHSTGGIGDKTSLVLAPLLASCGLAVPMISGRGLGATGGTLDKLEAIPGFRTDLSLAEIQATVERVGCVITGASAEIVPADRKLYALRDVTATVPSIPLITASIMSKKLAESLDALVLDVKFGSGAFMKTLDDARTLARSLVDTGNRMGVRTSALVTDMNQPLGRMAGNLMEVHEAIACLQGKGPAELWELTRALAEEVVGEGSGFGVQGSGKGGQRSEVGGREGEAPAEPRALLGKPAVAPSGQRSVLGTEYSVLSTEPGEPPPATPPSPLTTHHSPLTTHSLLDEHIRSGRALAKFAEMVAAQGGDLDRLPPLPAGREVAAGRGGFVGPIDTELLGLAIIELGGGRKVMTDKIDHGVGLEMLVRLGDHVETRQPLVRVFGSREQFAHVKPMIERAISVQDEPAVVGPLIVERIE
ncbi:MAG: thymidine phosphorylase [Planctomycetaceae bacterium]|nr:thymidine phosphorylase [Planctomycetaceae bacterium]